MFVGLCFFVGGLIFEGWRVLGEVGFVFGLGCLGGVFVSVLVWVF